MKKMKKAVLFAGIILLVLAAAAQAAISSLSVSYSLLESRTNPEDENILFLTFSAPSLAVYGVQATLSAGPYISLQKNYLDMGAISAGSSQQTSVKFSMNENAPSTITYILLHASYYKESAQKEELDVNIPIIIGKEPILQIQNVAYDSAPKPGSTVALDFDLTNYGADARDVRIALNQTRIISSPAEKFIDYLPSKSSKHFSFKLTIDPKIEPGIYSIPVALAYSDGTKTSSYNTTKTIGLEVSGDYNFIITAESVTENSITIKIANAGSQDAKFLIAKFSSSADIQPETVYIGDIKSDDYDSERLSIKVKPGKYEINVALEYKDIFGKEYNESRILEVEIPTKQAEQDFTWIMLLAFLAAAFLVYKRLSRKRK